MPFVYEIGYFVYEILGPVDSYRQFCNSVQE